MRRGIDRAVLVGNSMGGVHSFSTAIEYPARVAARRRRRRRARRLRAEVPPAEAELFAEMERLEAADPPDPDAIADIDVRGWVDGPGQPADRVPAWIRDTVRDWDRELNQPDRVTGRQVRLDPPAAERLAELSCPVLAVAGALDFSEVAATARHLAANAPDARAVVWDDVAHMIGMEQPERLAAEIVAFVGEPAALVRAAGDPGDPRGSGRRAPALQDERVGRLVVDAPGQVRDGPQVRRGVGSGVGSGCVEVDSSAAGATAASVLSATPARMASPAPIWASPTASPKKAAPSTAPTSGSMLRNDPATAAGTRAWPKAKRTHGSMVPTTVSPRTPSSGPAADGAAGAPSVSSAIGRAPAARP